MCCRRNRFSYRLAFLSKSPVVHMRHCMSDGIQPPNVNRNVLRELVAGLSDGIILLDPEGEISWANSAALQMHRISTIEELGGDAAGYRQAFTLRYRNNHLLEEGQYPIERLLKGETV